MIVAKYCATHSLPYFEAAHPTPTLPIFGIELADLRPHYFGSPLVYAARLEDAQFFGHSYIKSRGHYITDHQGFALDPARNGFGDYRALVDETPPVGEITQECFFFGGTWYDPLHPGPANFGHFMFEFMSRLSVFDRFNLLRLPCVVYNTIPPRWLDFLRLAGVSKFIFADMVNPPLFKSVWTASCPFHRSADGQFRMWQPAVHWLRTRLLQGRALGPPRRIYLARGDVRHRVIVNEDDATAVLARHGFEVIDPATLSASDQVRVMADAECVVAPAGAGTIITQFCPEHCRIIILTPKGKSGYWGGFAHAIHLRQRYQLMDCERVDNGQERIDHHGVNELADMRVDLEKLGWLVKSAT